MNFPTFEEVEKADRVKICRWHRFLPSADPDNDEQFKIQNRIYERYIALGGFTPEISKLVGWDKP